MNVSHPVLLTNGTDKLEFPGNTPEPVMAKALVGYLKQKDAGLPPPPSGFTLEPRDYDKLAAQIIESARYKANTYWHPVSQLIELALLPPLALLLAGIAAGWVVNGFRPPREL
jgi:hypothetical protein